MREYNLLNLLNKFSQFKFLNKNLICENDLK